MFSIKTQIVVDIKWDKVRGDAREREIVEEKIKAIASFMNETLPKAITDIYEKF